jgi:heme exporter protein B
MMILWRVFKQQIAREGLIQARQLSQSINTVLFFVMIIVFFPLALPPQSSMLKEIAPGLVWMAVLFSSMLASERFFSQDHEDGMIEQWLLSGPSLSLMVIAKLCVHWLLILIPLMLCCPLLAVLFQFSWYETLVLLLSLICGTPVILSLCALASAFSTGLQQKGVMVSLLVLPLTVPVMIFGSATLMAAMQGESVIGFFALLIAFSLISITLLPFAIAAILRVLV